MSTTTVNNGVEMPTSPPKVDIPNMAKTGTLATFTGQERTYETIEVRMAGDDFYAIY